MNNCNAYFLIGRCCRYNFVWTENMLYEKINYYRSIYPSGYNASLPLCKSQGDIYVWWWIIPGCLARDDAYRWSEFSSNAVCASFVLRLWQYLGEFEFHFPLPHGRCYHHIDGSLCWSCQHRRLLHILLLCCSSSSWSGHIQYQRFAWIGNVI